MINYNPLWKLLIDKNMKKTSFRLKCGLTTVTLSTMQKNKYITLKNVDKICNTLDCKIEDVIEHIKD